MDTDRLRDIAVPAVGTGVGVSAVAGWINEYGGAVLVILSIVWVALNVADKIRALRKEKPNASGE